MDILQQKLEVQALYDTYQALLTDKQKNYIEQYYFDDLSISEISENEQVSRNAVHDLVKRTVEKLYDYEQKLGLYDKSKQRDIIMNQIETTNNNESVSTLLEQLRKVE